MTTETSEITKPSEPAPKAKRVRAPKAKKAPAVEAKREPTSAPAEDKFNATFCSAYTFGK